MLYKGDDLMQNTDVSKEYPEIADELYKKSRETSLVIDYGYHNNMYNVQAQGTVEK